MIDVEIKCVGCGKVIVLRVPAKGFKDWLNGEYIQKAMPDLTADERELLLSQMCNKCFDEACAEEDE